MNNYLVATLIVLNLWFGLVYLFLPGFRLRRWFKADPEQSLENQAREMLKKSEQVQAMMGQKGVKGVAWSMMIAFFMMVWTLFLWGSIQAFGGFKGFCSAIIGG